MNNYQQGGQANPEQQMMAQIAQAFQQLSPESQQQLLQALSQMVGGGQQAPPQEATQEMMRMGGVRPRKNNMSQMYR